MLKAVVGDSRDELAHTIRALLERVDLLILCGGLGPTDDDVTREAVAAALERPLTEDEAITARLRERFKARGFAMPMPEINRRQAMVPGRCGRDREHARQRARPVDRSRRARASCCCPGRRAS